MGVQNLWVLLAPVGRQVEIESLAGEVLAVDASIWLTQFVKAMRDDEGNMIRNAHLVGTFHRVAKLLFYGVRPVFVFDGDTPEIKKRTTARRRKRQENQAANLRQTAQRILINQIKLRREELKKNGGAPAPAIDPHFLIPEASTPAAKPSSDRVTEAKDSSSASQEEEEEEEEEEEVDADERASLSTLAAASASSMLEDDVVSVESEEELTIDDIDLDTSRLNKIDLRAVFSLPPHLQKDMVQKILRDRRQEVRDKFIPLAGQPEAYSHVQISSFLATVKLNRRIEAARRETTQEELQAEEKVANTSSPANSTGHIIGHGKRIASNSSKFFIYEKASDKTSADSLKKSLGSSRRSEAILTSANDSDNESSSEKELMAGFDETAEAEANAAGVETYGLSLDDRFAPNKRRRKMQQGPGPGKMSLSDFSIQAFATQTEQHLRQQQELQWNVDGARSAWLTRHHLQAKHEPELAIERVRRARLGLPERNGDNDGVQSASMFGSKHSDDGNASMKATTKAGRGAASAGGNGDESKAALEASLPATNMSAKSASAEKQRSNGDDINEEEVLTIDVDGDGDEDDDIEWEDVKDTATDVSEPGVTSSASAPVQSIETHSTTSTPGAIEDAIGVEGKAKNIDPEGLNQVDRGDGTRQGSVDLSDSETDEERGDEMMLTLKSEIEDAKAEEDLNLLKEEALHSAMVTASNLTQWAAGAVRRALEAHTQHSKKVAPQGSGGQPWTPTRPLLDGSTQEKAINVDEERKSPQSTKPAVDEAEHIDQSVEDEQKGEKPAADKHQWPEETEMNDEQLQAALEASLREESVSAASSNSRYLRYASSTAAGAAGDSTAVGSSSAEDDRATVQSLEQEQRELKKLRNRQQRDVEGVNDEMVQDVMELLRLFGVPYLVCPMEAEAQCAALEMLGLVDGIITDDSDIFPFGGKKVYKNIFHNQKFVEAFFAQDVQKELGFSREDVIALAMLLGSDYTDGVRGIGIVNATEVVNAFPGIDGLREFKQWVQSFDLAEEAQRAALRKKKTDAELEQMTPRERFEHTHASVRRKWELGEAFPNTHVVQAYLNPQVDKSEERFSWNLPDLAGLREFCTQTFGWDQAKTDGTLLPLMERAALNASVPGRAVQTRIDHFFRSYDDQVMFAKIKSKRLRSAVEGRTSIKTGDGDVDQSRTSREGIVVIDDDDADNDDPPSQPASSAAKTTSRFFAKKKTSMAAMAGGRGGGRTKATPKRKSSTKK